MNPLVGLFGVKLPYNALLVDVNRDGRPEVGIWEIEFKQLTWCQLVGDGHVSATNPLS